MKKLAKPKIEPIEEDGEVVAIYVRLQIKSRKAVRTFQPNENELVFFYLDEDGAPVGIMFHFPCTGLAISRILETVINCPDGSRSVQSKTRHYFLTDPNEIVRVLAAFEGVVHQLSEPAMCSEGHLVESAG